MSKEIVLNKMYVVKDVSCIEGALIKEGDVLIAIGDVNSDLPYFFNTRTEKKVIINRYRVEPLKAELKGATVSAMILDESSALPNSHYQTTIQPIETMQSNMSPEAFQGYLRGNVIKYACRIGKKDEQLKEAKKILEYAKWLVESIEGKTINPRPKAVKEKEVKYCRATRTVDPKLIDRDYRVQKCVEYEIECELNSAMQKALKTAARCNSKLIVSPITFSQRFDPIQRFHIITGEFKYEPVRKE